MIPAKKRKHGFVAISCTFALAALSPALPAQTLPSAAADATSTTESVALAQPDAGFPATENSDDLPFVSLHTVDSEIRFDFGRSVLQPAGRTVLDDFVAKIKGFDAWLILVIGHSDRLETTANATELAAQRAQAIRSYLLAKGVQPSLIHVQIRGAASPVTKADECAGPKTAQVIACLQPDRRVDLEMAGLPISR